MGEKVHSLSFAETNQQKIGKVGFHSNNGRYNNDNWTGGVRVSVRVQSYCSKD